MALTDSRIRLAFPILLFAAWLVYRPALNRVFTADQVWYFAELNGSTSLLEGLKRVDYSAARRYWKGDESLFRPLLFVWLAVENSFFSYHHVRWNAANLVLHSLVAFLLCRLLISIRRSCWALGVALLFAVLKPPLELVIWNHLGGYLFACVFLAIGLRAFVKLMSGDERAQRHRAVFATSFTAAGLFYETMIPISLLAAALIILVDTRRGRPLTAGGVVALAAPILIYAGLYVFHLQHVSRLFYVDNPDAATGSMIGRVAANLPHAAAAAWRWVLDLLFPSAVVITPAPFDRFQKDFSFSSTSPANLMNLALVVLGLVVAAASLSTTHLKRVWPLLLLLAGGLLLYGFVICMGRPLSLVLSGGYYPYIACLLLTVFGYGMIDFDRLHGWRAALAAVVLTGAVAMHASGTLAVTRQVGRLSAEPSRLLSRMANFVDAHKSEPGFTFAARTHLQSLDPPIALREGYPDDPAARVERVPFTEIVFKKYYDARNPKYIFEQSPQ